MHERRTDDEHRAQVGGRRDDRGDAVAHGVEQRVLQQQVVDGVAGQAQLREDRDRDALVVAGARLPRARLGVGAGSATAIGIVQAATRANPWA